MKIYSISNNHFVQECKCMDLGHCILIISYFQQTPLIYRVKNKLINSYGFVHWFFVTSYSTTTKKNRTLAKYKLPKLKGANKWATSIQKLKMGYNRLLGNILRNGLSSILHEINHMIKNKVENYLSRLGIKKFIENTLLFILILE